MVNLASFWKPEACGQIVLPDRSLLIGQKFVGNAKIENFKCDIFGDFQPLCRRFSNESRNLTLSHSSTSSIFVPSLAILNATFSAIFKHCMVVERPCSFILFGQLQIGKWKKNLKKKPKIFLNKNYTCFFQSICSIYI